MGKKILKETVNWKKWVFIYSILLIFIIIFSTFSHQLYQPSIGEFETTSNTFSPDLVIIEEISWQKFLSAVSAVSKINSLPPIVFLKEEKISDIKNFINFLMPQKMLILKEEKSPSSILKKFCRLKNTVCLYGDHIKTSASLANRRWGKSYRAILVSDDDYQGALLSCPLACRYGCPLLFFSGESIPELTIHTLIKLQVKEIIVVGKLNKEMKRSLKTLPAKIVFISDESSLTNLYLKTIPSQSVNNLIVTNPEDINESLLSLLSAPFSIINNAPILFSYAESAEIENKIRDFEQKYNLSLKYLTLVGNDEVLPQKRVPDPVYSMPQNEEIEDRDKIENFKKGNDIFPLHPIHQKEKTFILPEEISETVPQEEERNEDVVNKIKVEIGSYPVEEKPLSLAVGRIVSEDIYDGTLLLGKIISYQKRHTKLYGNVLLFSNEGGTLDLCEIISRATVNEFKNSGVPVEAYYRQEINNELLKKKLPEKDVVLWEGHLYGITNLFEEDMVKFSPCLFFSQSCDSLDSSYAYPLFRTGTIAYIGSNSYIHSASGAAFTKAFFDAVLYEDMDVGSALLYAKNYLLTWVNLKKKKGHSEWAKAYRVALSFSLWGDPTTKLYLKTSPKPKLSLPRIKRFDNHLILIVPPAWYKEIETEKYYTKFPPGGKFAGVVKSKKGKGKRKVPPLLFTHINLNDISHLKLETSDLKEEEWSYLWDEKRKVLYLLVYPENFKKGDVFVFAIKK